MPLNLYRRELHRKLTKISNSAAKSRREQVERKKPRKITLQSRIRIKSKAWPRRIRRHFKGKDQIIARRLLFHMSKGEVSGKDGLFRTTISTLKKSGKVKFDPSAEIKTVREVFDKLVRLRIIEYAPRGFGKSKK